MLTAKRGGLNVSACVNIISILPESKILFYEYTLSCNVFQRLFKRKM